MKHFIYSIILLTLSSCSGLFTSTHSLRGGDYTLLLEIDSIRNPVRLKIQVDSILSISIINDTEVISCDSVSVNGDSIVFKLPIFNSIFKGVLTSDTTFEGEWINYHKGNDYKIPFSASINEPNASKNKMLLPLGRWDVTFSKGTEDESKAIGVFNRSGTKITGTFLTETGDYRFLEGKIAADNHFYLSCFDGSHAFYFNGVFTNDSTISRGTFYSGKHHNEPWEGIRNDSIKLRDPYSLTYLNPGYDKISFSFPDLGGKPVSLADDQFKDKVTIIQIMGSWCPNCLDESVYFSDLYKRRKEEGLEIIALAYEARPDFAYASERVRVLKQRLHSDYTFLIAGTSNKEEAQKTLPMLNKILSFPTTIILDRSHNIHSIYTGFSGPSTGQPYIDYKKETEQLLDSLLN